MPNLVTLSFAGPIATLALHRPEARNALSPEMLGDLHERLDELRRACDADPGGERLRVCIVRGDGRTFCAGMDLRVVMEEEGAALRLLTSLAEATLKVRSIPIPTIARVQGAAIGGGCGLACVCDFALTHDDAKLGYPEVDLGVCPAVVAPWLVQRIGAGPARRVLLEGGTVSGKRGAEIGLVTASVGAIGAAAERALDEAVAALVTHIAGAGPRAVRATKRWLNQQDGSDALGDAVRRGAAISAEVVSHPETLKGLRERFGGKG